ncbi:hypothetical protein [Massilia sp. YIM B04103]|uniref:hypothetical protein n=1 Tax=Massilia sp. YIM B04103 TaxID=2963106 RepID=UPI002108F762
MNSIFGATVASAAPAAVAAVPEHAIHIRSLDEYLCSDLGFHASLARAVGAVAAANGTLTLAQFAAITDIAGEGKASALFTAVVLNAIESGVTVDWALGTLGRASADTDAATRDGAFALVKPLLALQAKQARPLAHKFARALNLRLRPDQLFGLPPEDERRLLNNLGSQARKLVMGRGLVDAVADFGRSTGQAELLDHARGFKGGMLDQQQLLALVREAIAAISEGIAVYQENAGPVLACEAGASSLLMAASQLKRQVQQRLALVDSRVAYERRMLWQDIDDVVHDAGNAIELAITERLHTDQWKDDDVWDSIARDQFGQEMERRLDRVVRRKEEALELLNQDLRLFQADIRGGQSNALERQHHAALARLMPRLRIGTRLANRVDTAANVTLMGGAVAAAGTGTALYIFGMAVVLPAVAPVAPFVGGAVLLAGAFKWLNDGGRRKRSEIQDKRRAFEEGLRKRLNDADAVFCAQLDRIAASFHESAVQLLTPLLLEAEAAGRVQSMRKRIADKVISQSRAAISQLQADLARA